MYLDAYSEQADVKIVRAIVISVLLISLAVCVLKEEG